MCLGISQAPPLKEKIRWLFKGAKSNPALGRGNQKKENKMKILILILLLITSFPAY